MAGILYFFPGRSGMTVDEVAKLGLAEVITNFSVRGVTNSGPGGKAGMIVAPQQEQFGSHIGYFPEEQTWEKSATADHWLGIYKDNPPKPEDLAREEQIAGHELVLGDGQKWLVPVARSFQGLSPLPQRLRLGPEGKLVGEMLPRYIAMSEAAERVWEDWKLAVSQGETGEEPRGNMDIEHGWRIAVMALSVNYRIDPDEASLLGLIDTQCLAKVLRAIIDIPTFLAIVRAREESAKKKCPAAISDGSGSSGGTGAS